MDQYRATIDRSMRDGTPLSPHTWGWTGANTNTASVDCVVPTHVGVDRCPRCSRGPACSLSPHTWGWTVESARCDGAESVVTTHVGVHPREFQYPGYGCPADGWLYFIVAGLNIDRSQLWLEYVAGTERGELAFWTLAERPAAGEPRGGR